MNQELKWPSGYHDGKWQDLENHIAEKYYLPGFQLWSDGYNQGEAEPHQVHEAANAINQVEGKVVVWAIASELDDEHVETNIFDWLNRKFLELSPEWGLT